MTKLALTLPLGDTEPPYSYVSRLAALNGSFFAQDFAFDMGVPWSSITNGDSIYIRKMARLASVRTEDLELFNIVRTSDRCFRLARERMKGKTMMRKDIKVCPKCLAEDAIEHCQYAPYLRARWTITSYRICSKHKVPLARLERAEYPRCMYDVAQRLNDQKAMIDAGNHYDHPKFGVSFSRYLRQRITGRSGNSWLDGLNLDLVCRFCEALGMLLAFGATVRVRNCDETDLAIATERGFKVANGGPEKIMEMMSAVRKSAASERNGFYVDFGVFYDFLNKLDHGDKQNAPILDLTANFAFRDYSYGKGDILFGRICPKRYNYCPSSLAARYGIARTTARKFMRSVGGDEVTQGRPVLKTERIIPVMERFRHSILPSEAAAKLGIPGEAFMRLVKAGLIQPCPQIANTIVRFDAENIAAFKRQMFGKSAEVAYLSDEWIPLNRAGQNFGYKLDRVCKLILDGSFGIVRHCSTASSLYHLHLNKADVHAYMSATSAVGYSKAELRRILAINDPTVAHIVRNGMMSGIAATNPHNNKKMIRFLPDEIDAFLRQYLPLGLFARRAEMQPRAAMLYFAKLDLEALDWPRKYSRIYRRADLPSEISKMQIGWAPPTV